MSLDDLQHPSLMPRGEKGERLRAELAALKAKETDCGVCGVPAFCMVEVGRSGYAVPRCKDHKDAPPYQAEARLESLLALAHTQQKDNQQLDKGPQGEGTAT